MIEFEFTALFKISLKQTYPNQERIQKMLVGGCSFDLVRMLTNYKNVWIRERTFKLFKINCFHARNVIRIFLGEGHFCAF